MVYETPLFGVVAGFFILLRAIFRAILIIPQVILDAIIYTIIEQQEIVGFEFVCKKQVHRRKEDIRYKAIQNYLKYCYNQVNKKNEKKE